MATSERWEALRALASSASSTRLSCMDCSVVYGTPRVAQRLAHNWTYSSIMPGTAGTVIWPSANDRRYIRLTIASRSIDQSNALGGGSSTRLFYTTLSSSHSGSLRHRGLTSLCWRGIG